MSVTVFGALFGVVGVLLGAPVTAAVYCSLGDYIGKKENAAAQAAVQERPDGEKGAV